MIIQSRIPNSIFRIQNAALGILTCFLITGCDYFSTPWDAIRANSQGVIALKAGSGPVAGDFFAQALAVDPYQSELHINLGLAFDVQKKNDEALQSLQNAEKLSVTDDQHFYARFDLGENYGRLKKYDEALNWYQKALEIRPGSVETKINIELLIQQQQGQGEGDSQDQKDGQKGKDDKKDQKGKDGDSKDDKDKKDQDQKDQDQKDGKDKDQQQKKAPDPHGDAKYKPRPFKGELNESDVKKILGEIKQQEQKIRAEYNRKEVKERPRDKDW